MTISAEVSIDWERVFGLDRMMYLQIFNHQKTGKVGCSGGPEYCMGVFTNKLHASAWGSEDVKDETEKAIDDLQAAWRAAEARMQERFGADHNLCFGVIDEKIYVVVEAPESEEAEA